MIEIVFSNENAEALIWQLDNDQWIKWISLQDFFRLKKSFIFNFISFDNRRESYRSYDGFSCLSYSLVVEKNLINEEVIVMVI